MAIQSDNTTKFLFEDELNRFDQLYPLQGLSLVRQVENEEFGTSRVDDFSRGDYALAELCDPLNQPTQSDQVTHLKNRPHETQNQRTCASLQELFNDLGLEASINDADQVTHFENRPHETQNQRTCASLQELFNDPGFEDSINDAILEGAEDEIPEDLNITEKDLEWSVVEPENEKVNDPDFDIDELLKLAEKDIDWSDVENEGNLIGNARRINREKSSRNENGEPERNPRSTGEKPYACDQCNYTARKREHLLKHMRTHTGEKPYACDECEYKCRTSHSLRLHKRRHTGEKPYACDECEYKCRTSHSLQYHKRRHTGEKPYACDQCEYKCTQMGNLRRHTRTHTGVKPYACDQCGYKCTHRSYLQRHKKTHRVDNPALKPLDVENIIHDI